MNFQLFPFQSQNVQSIRERYRAGDQAVLYQLSTGGGKCLGKDTPVLMFDGTVKPVQDVRHGDLLMGPDSKPRIVSSICSGREMLYRVTPVKGDSYIVNESHILSLKTTKRFNQPTYPSQKGEGGEIVNIELKKWVSSPSHFKHVHKGWRTGVDFPAHSGPALLEPYFLGVWLGDGSSHVAYVTTGDREIVDYLREYAERLGLRINICPNSANSETVKILDHSPRGRGGTSIMNALRHYGLTRNKHVPHRYRTGTREERLQVLAGIIDTDGSWTGKGYDICLKSERLMDDLIFVARSLGFAAYKKPTRKKCHNTGAEGDYWRCNIHGHVDEIPCLIPRKKAARRLQKKNHLVTGITVEPIGEGEYFGFELSGPDRLFLLGDFTVTHNTYTFCYIAESAAKLGNRVWILVHRKELIRQTSQSLRVIGVHHGIIAPGFTPDPFAPIQICSVQTLVNRLGKVLPPHLIIVDECHHTIAASYAKILAYYHQAKVLGVTATPVRLDGRGLGRHCGGHYDSMVNGPPLSELISMKRLVMPKIYAPPIGADLGGLHKRYGDFVKAEVNAAMDKPVITGCAVEHYRTICHNVPAIAFCASVAHAENVAGQFRARGYNAASVDGCTEDKERDKRIADLGNGGLHVLTSCDIISEGTDIPVVGAAILLRPSASLSMVMQQIGRALRVADGKECAYVLDHVGNIDRHELQGMGRPEWDLEWSLDGEVKKKKKAGESGPGFKQCEKCYSVHSPAPVCPCCGHVYEVKAREVEQVDGKLQEIDPATIQRLQKIEEDRARFSRLREERDCRCYKDFKELGKKRGYAPSWPHIRYNMWWKRNTRLADAEEARCLTLESLEELARNRGHRKGWAQAKYDERQAALLPGLQGDLYGSGRG